MVFHSYQFIFGFLPLVYLGYLAAHRLGGWTCAFRFLAVASLVFYGLFSPRLTLVLAASVIANYYIGNVIRNYRQQPERAWQLLLGAIALNILALGYFKYSNFLIDIANALAGSETAHIRLLVPVGVSFFTFVQIGYLVEVYNGQVERPGFERYAIFAGFFPCVTAGPLVLQREMLDQMQNRTDSPFSPDRIAIGLTMFTIGLFKKVVLADSIAPFADQVFNGAAGGAGLSAATAWLGALAYALQLYFDFSGYSDMALGLGIIFGLKLPLNFDSPFKATSISDFWRRWHITMTRFFTTYVFSPLAMNGMRRAVGQRKGPVEKFLLTGGIPAVITFLVAGIWHGAGWTFVVYGLLHGCAIAVNIAWREARRPELPPVLGWLLTMSVVVTGLVIFRAPNLETAGVVLGHMWMPGFGAGAAAAAEIVTIDKRMALSMVVLLGSIVLLMPNSQQIMHRNWISSDAMPATVRAAAGLLRWRPSFSVAVALGTTLSLAIGSIGAATSFVYYQF